MHAWTAGMLLLLLWLRPVYGEESIAKESPPKASMVEVPAGTHRPLFVPPGETNSVQVPAFWLDRHPVTNGDYLEFVSQNPKWRRSQVKRIFADENYLRHWAGDLEPGEVAAAQQPVTWISWFAAKAYAQWRGKRLPTVTEWEYAAAYGFSARDGSKEPEFQSAIRRWYSTPSPASLPLVAQGRPNILGIHDLHGLVWEWTSDFNSSLVSGDARGDSGIERQLFCGVGSAGNRNPSDYPAFLRYGFRSSLKASYCIHNLGFRCAADL